MGRPAKADAKKVLPVRVAPSGYDWITATAAELGLTPSEFARALIAKGAAAYRAGWRPER